jgi:hypothetical protein
MAEFKLTPLLISKKTRKMESSWPKILELNRWIIWNHHTSHWGPLTDLARICKLNLIKKHFHKSGILQFTTQIKEGKTEKQAGTLV